MGGKLGVSTVRATTFPWCQLVVTRRGSTDGDRGLIDGLATYLFSKKRQYYDGAAL